MGNSINIRRNLGSLDLRLTSIEGKLNGLEIYKEMSSQLIIKWQQ